MQNLKAESVFEKDPEHEIEYSALDGSLRIMSQVLNVSVFIVSLNQLGYLIVSHLLVSVRMYWISRECLGEAFLQSHDLSPSTG